MSLRPTSTTITTDLPRRSARLHAKSSNQWPFEPIITLLPPELMIHIFKYLPHSDRINCKLVCKVWQEILMTDHSFRSNRMLKLNNCVLHPKLQPLSIFKNAVFQYDNLSIGPAITFTPQCDTIWSTHFSNVKELLINLKPKDGPLPRSFNVKRFAALCSSMRQLRYLTVVNFSFNDGGHSISFTEWMLDILTTKDITYPHISDLIIIHLPAPDNVSQIIRLFEVIEEYYKRMPALSCLALVNMPHLYIFRDALMKFMASNPDSFGNYCSACTIANVTIIQLLQSIPQ